MINVRIAICEDIEKESLALAKLVKKYCDSVFVSAQIDVFASGEGFLQKFVPGYYQIAFLDIYMSGLSGMDVAKNLLKEDPSCMIIFITGSLNHAVEGFRVNAADYLVKPLDYQMVETALLRCRQSFAKSMQFIEIKTNRLNRKILIKDILYAEVYANTCVLHTETEDVASRMTLEGVELQLRASLGVQRNYFLRCHRSYLVNMNCISHIGEDGCLMKNGDVIPIRRMDRKKVQKLYLDYVFLQTIGESG